MSSTVVAWLALVVAAASLAWQIFTWWARQKTQVRISIRHLAVPASLEGTDLLAFSGLGIDTHPVVWAADEDQALTYALAVIVVNNGETKEVVQDIRLCDAAKRQGVGADDGTSSRELPPRDRVAWTLRVDRLPFDLSSGFYIAVALGSGRWIDSGPHHLDQRLTQSVDAHNATLR